MSKKASQLGIFYEQHVQVRAVQVTTNRLLDMLHKYDDGLKRCKVYLQGLDYELLYCTSKHLQKTDQENSNNQITSIYFWEISDFQANRSELYKLTQDILEQKTTELRKQNGARKK